jgi:hypothetical protein
MRGVPRARFRETEHLKNTTSDGLNVHIAQDVLHFILCDVFLWPISNNGSDISIDYMSNGCKDLLEHVNISLFCERGWEFKLEIGWLRFILGK